MLAFGDLTESEAAQVRAMADQDPEAAQVLRAYESMRSDLRSMSDSVPADQLSKERLQDAILKRGLEEQAQPRRWLGWVMAPAAMTVLFAVVLALQMERQPSPMVYNDGSVPEATTMAREAEPALKVDPANKVSTERLALKPEPDAVEKPAVSPVKRTKRRPSGGTRVVKLDKPAAEASTKVSQPTMAAIPISMDAPKIVLIQNDKDLTTGALKAVETEAYSGVLVGS